MESTKNNAFVFPNVEHILFEENTVIETSGNNEGRFGYRGWQHNESNPDNPNWRFHH